MNNLSEKLAEKLEKLEREYDETEQLIGCVEIAQDPKLYKHYKVRLGIISPVVELYKELKIVERTFSQNSMLLRSETDPELISEAQLENRKLGERENELIGKIKDKLKSLELSSNQNCTVEVSLKQGETERLSELKRVFDNYALQFGYNMSYTKQSSSGFTFKIEGENCYGDIVIFSGNSKFICFGRESIIGIMVFLNEVFDDKISDEDISIETLKSSGAGGQHINKTESAIRVTHIPTGLSCVVEDERSQKMNKERALGLLQGKVSEFYRKKCEKNIEFQRKNQKNAFFSQTPTSIFDFDRNTVYVLKTKNNYPLKSVLGGNLKIISRDIIYE